MGRHYTFSHLCVCVFVCVNVCLFVLLRLLLLRASTNAVVTCELKLFRNYFIGLLQLINIFQHVQRR